MKPGMSDARFAFLLVQPFIERNASKEIRKALKISVVTLKVALERLALQLRVLTHKLHVLMFGMIFKIGV